MTVDSPPVIHRARVTYGRTRDSGIAPDADTSLTADTSILSNSSLYGISSADGPPSSDAADAPSSPGLSARDSSPDPSASPHSGRQAREYQFAWRRKLAQMDTSDEEGEGGNPNTCLLDPAPGSLSLLDGTEEGRPSPSPSARPSPETSLPGSQLFLAPSPRGSKKKHIQLPSPTHSEAESQSASPPSSCAPLLKHPSPVPSTPIAPVNNGETPAALSPLDGLGSRSDDESQTYRKQQTRRTKRTKEKRVKPLTRKEREETEKSTARIRAAQPVEVPRGQTKFCTVSQLFQRVVPAQSQQYPLHIGAALSSDIEQFSSPNTSRFNVAAPPPLPLGGVPTGSSLALHPSKHEEETIAHSPGDSDHEMPDAMDLLTQHDRASEKRRLAEALAERKKRALQAPPILAEASDDELEVMPTPDREPLQANSFPVSRPQLLESRKRKVEPPITEVSLGRAAMGAFEVSGRKARGGPSDRQRLGAGALNRYLLQNANKEVREIVEHKEREWRSTGGKIVESQAMTNGGSFSISLAALLQQGRQLNTDAQEDEDNTPRDISPQIGDSPGSQKIESADFAEPAPWDDVVQVSQSCDHIEDEELIPLKRHRARTRPSFLPPSDDEKDTFRYPSDSNAENETDKENDVTLMFDHGEDKENTAIHTAFTASPSPRSTPAEEGRINGGLLATDSNRTQESAFERSPRTEGRQPLRDLSKEPFTLGAPKLLYVSPASPLAVGEGSVNQGNPAFLNASGASDGTSSVLDAGFSQLFQAGSVVRAPSNPTRAFSQFVTPVKELRGLSGLRKPVHNALSLSLAPTLQPALELPDSLQKRADDIFAKEQDLMVGTEEQAPASSPEPQVFINENGFLTQTRPSNLDVARLLSSAQSTRVDESPLLQSSTTRSTTERRPLRELDISEEQGGQWSCARPGGGYLKRRRVSPVREDGDVSPSPSPTKRRSVERDAFQIMRGAQAKRAKKLKLKRSEFVDGQAEESDEDERFGFGKNPKPRDDEEEDEEDEEEAKQLNNEMVDDTTMDETTLNEIKVLEKHREQQEEDDAIAEKIAQDAISGKLRAKQRQRGIGFEDDDDSDEDEDNTARRQKLVRHKRKLGDFDSLDALGKDEKHVAFLRTYEAGLVGDDQDFAHLEHDNASLRVERTEGVEGVDDQRESDSEEEPEISITKLTKDLREVARGEQVVDAQDPNDLSWMDEDPEVDASQDVRIREVSHSKTNPKGAGPSLQPSGNEWEFDVRRLRYDNSMENRVFGNGLPRGSVVGRPSAATVTGHVRAKHSNGSIIGQRNAAAKAPKQSAKALSKAPSKLSAMASRREHFMS